MKRLIVPFLVFFSLTLFLILFSNTVNAQEDQTTIQPPTILNADLKNIHQRWGRPIIVGLTPADSDVTIHIDGKFVGFAHVNKGAATDNFYFQPKNPLLSGSHVIEAQARDKKTGTYSYVSESVEIVVEGIPAPTPIAPNEKSILGTPKPEIKGLTVSGTFLRVYIDGIYNGKTGLAVHESGTAGFTYKPFLNLAPGKHNYQLVAETPSGEKSPASPKVKFNIGAPLPAPIILKQIENQATYNRPIIAGVVKNDLMVKIFVDHKLEKKIEVMSHESGTANFAYTLNSLTDGIHLIYVTSVDAHGKESMWSNIIYTNIEKETTPSDDIATEEENVQPQEEKEEEHETKDSAITDKAPSTDEPVSTEDKNEPEVENDSVIEDILKVSTTTPDETSGLIDEKKESTGKFKLNLGIFLAFLAIVIGWIFWVNRELIKEKQDENNNEEKKQDDLNL